MHRAAVILVLALGLVACSDDGKDGGDAAGSTTTSTTAPATSTSSSVATTTTGAINRGPATVAERWVDAIAAGDLDAAWELTAERSRQSVGGREEFGRMEIELAEGWAAWGRSEDVSFSPVAASIGSEQIDVVVLQGVVAQEGPPEIASAALPVRAGRVDPFVDLGDVEHVPEPGTTVTARQHFEAYVDAQLAGWFIVDQGPTMNAQPEPGGPAGRRRLTFTPPAALTRGPHTVTVVVADENGAVMVRTADYVVER